MGEAASHAEVRVVGRAFQADGDGGKEQVALVGLRKSEKGSGLGRGE